MIPVFWHGNNSDVHVGVFPGSKTVDKHSTYWSYKLKGRHSVTHTGRKLSQQPTTQSKKAKAGQPSIKPPSVDRCIVHNFHLQPVWDSLRLTNHMHTTRDCILPPPLSYPLPTLSPLAGCLGALPLAGIIGFLCGLFTFLFMFYDSDVPGNFPPTPVSPRREKYVTLLTCMMRPLFLSAVL